MTFRVPILIICCIFAMRFSYENSKSTVIYIAKQQIFCDWIAFVFSGGSPMKEIIINSNTYGLKAVQVDDEDYEYMNQWKWCVTKSYNTFYATRTDYKNTDEKHIKMHRLITGCKNGDGKILDHKDGNGLNNQKLNIRKCTHSQNNMNKKSWGVSKYLGVSLFNQKRNGKIYTYWRASIRVNGKSKTLTQSTNEIKCAIIYNEAAKKYHGEFARLNIVTQS